MNRPAWKSIVSGVMSVGFVGLLAAQTPTLNVKLGLWEMTMTMDMSGMMAGMDMSKMTPEQQAAMASMMRGRGGAMPAIQMKTCMTPEKVSRGAVAPDRPGTTCTSKIVKATATAMDYSETCTGQMPSTSEMHVEATSPTSVKLTGKTTTTMRGQPQTATVTIVGTWLADACGDVK
jgi:Protein of unknown function (DUF3617)